MSPMRQNSNQWHQSAYEVPCIKDLALPILFDTDRILQTPFSVSHLNRRLHLRPFFNC